MKKALTILILVLVTGTAVMAQSAERRFALGGFFGKNEYWGEVGNAFMDFGQKFYSFGGLTARLYADNSFDYSLNADFGKIGYTKNDVEIFKGNLQLFSFKVHYKFYNGYILKEEAKWGPFVTVGAGYETNWGTQDWIDQGAVVFPVGAGLNYKINEAWTVQLQSLLNFSIHNAYRNTEYYPKIDDKFFSHSIGLVYSFGKCKGRKEIAPPPPPPPPVPVVSAETQKIFDQALQGVQFETGKDIIKPESFPILDNVVKVMKDNPGYKLEINGHTDNVGDAAMNLDLSKRRAISVKNYLVSKGVAENRLKPEGFGETRPVADNGTPEGRAKNRRVEFKVVSW